jgi:hypothetical protein
MVKSKIAIQGAALPYVLCELFGKDNVGGVTKDDNDQVRLQLTILGALKCDDEIEFQNLFGLNTLDGLNRRFIFGVAPSDWEYEPYTIMPEPMRMTYSVQVPMYCWDMVKEWKHKDKLKRHNLGELALRIALITSFMNQDISITTDAMTTALRFMEWQESIRDDYKAGEAETREAEVEQVIVTVLTKLGVDVYTNWTKLYKNKHLDRKGCSLVNRVRDVMIREGMIGYDSQTKTIWLKA